jgi:hypothetical protein
MRLEAGQMVDFMRLTTSATAKRTICSATEWTAELPMPPEAKWACAMEGLQLETSGRTAQEYLMPGLAPRGGSTLTVYCRCGRSPGISTEEVAYRDFLLTLHNNIKVEDRGKIQFRNGDGVVALWGTIISYPIVTIFACAILIKSDTSPVAGIAILSLIIVFAMFVLCSPTRRFYDPNALPARILPSSESWQPEAFRRRAGQVDIR